MKTLSSLLVAIATIIGCSQLVLVSSSQTNNNRQHEQIYLDVKPANTTLHLESIRRLPLSTYRLSYERSTSTSNNNNEERKRVGVVGSELASIIPDAVDIVPQRTLPPREKGGKPIVLNNFPSINEQTLFMYSVGGVQELDKLMTELERKADAQMNEVASLYGEISQLEHILSASSDGDAELRMREAAAKAEIAKNTMEMEVLRAKQEEEYALATLQAEEEQLKKSEQLTLERLKREDEAARVRTEQLLRAKFEASQRIEQTKAQAVEAVAAVEHEQKLLLQKAGEEMKVKTAKEVAKAKAEAERANEDVHIRRLQAESEQRRKRNVAAINAVFTHLSTSLAEAAKNPKQVLLFIGYTCLLTSSIFLAREASKLVRSIIEATIGKPQLIRETTRKNMPWSLFSYVVQVFSYLFSWILVNSRNNNSSSSIEESFDDLILPQELKERVLDLAHSARNARRHNAPFRHVLLYGPPGTGKTMVAKKLAKIIGIDYALMSGGDVSPLGSDAVTQIHNLFNWAKMSPKGVILFIDEAECFLGSRDSGLMSDTAHNALNALLYNTGGERKDFMLVLATNRAEDLDAAVLDRCDESIFFPLPNAECRKDLILLYFDLHFRKFMETNNQQALSLKSQITRYFTKQPPLIMSIENDLMTGEQLQSTVNVTYGFSGREIGKLMVALQGAMYVSKDGKLDFVAAWKLIETKVREHQEKMDMLSARQGGGGDGGSRQCPQATGTSLYDIEEYESVGSSSGGDDDDDKEEEYSFPTLLNKFDNKENKKKTKKGKGLSPKSSKIRTHAHILLSRDEMTQ